AFEAPNVEDLIEAEYRPKSFLRRRAPDEIETALTQLDQGALNMVKQSFKNNLDLADFAKAIVSTGTYDADRILAFVSGVVDLYLEVFRSQADSDEKAVKWAQLMNHFIESPEIVMFEGSEVASAIVGPKSASSTNMAQVRRSNLVDCAKHMGATIRKISWMPSLEMLTTVEGTESVYFWSPSMAWETARVVTPQLPPDYFDEGKPLWTVHAVAWDESQDLVALLSNRFLVFWRLRNREKVPGPHFHGVAVPSVSSLGAVPAEEGVPLPCHAARGNQLVSAPAARGSRAPFRGRIQIGLTIWTGRHEKGILNEASPSGLQEANEEEVVRSKDKKDAPEILLGEKAKAESSIQGRWTKGENAVNCRPEFRGSDEGVQWTLRRLAAEAAQQLDIWWNASMKVWVSADYEGRLYLWDLREHTIESTIYPMKVTSFLELSSFKFTTCSLDRSARWLLDLMLYFHKDGDTGLGDADVLREACLRVVHRLDGLPWGLGDSVVMESDQGEFRARVRAKLSAHQANLAQVSTGQRVFVTLDEVIMTADWQSTDWSSGKACIFILWDGATLQALQTNCSTLAPKHVVVLPSSASSVLGLLGRIILASRRLNFFVHGPRDGELGAAGPGVVDGNEQGSIALGAAPSKEQLALAKRREEGASLKDRAAPRWCGLAPSRGEPWECNPV
ncbi:unnamed protein product, partial [Cladocopium goreaui]